MYLYIHIFIYIYIFIYLNLFQSSPSYDVIPGFKRCEKSYKRL